MTPVERLFYLADARLRRTQDPGEAAAWLEVLIAMAEDPDARPMVVPLMADFDESMLLTAQGLLAMRDDERSRELLARAGRLPGAAEAAQRTDVVVPFPARP